MACGLAPTAAVVPVLHRKAWPKVRGLGSAGARVRRWSIPRSASQRHDDRGAWAWELKQHFGLPRLASPRLASLCLARHRRPCPCWAVQRPVQRGRTVQHRWQEAKKDAERYAWLCECVTIGGLYFIPDAASLLPFVASSGVRDSSNTRKSSTKSSNKNG